MEKFEIVGGNRLLGNLRLKGAKNSVLPLLSASLLTEEEVTINDCPNLLDIQNMVKILSSLGVAVETDGDKIKTRGRILHNRIPDELAKEMRSSVFLLGSMLAMTGRAVTAFPGGCAIGERPIDLHIKGLRQLGVNIIETGAHIDCSISNGNGSAKNLNGADIYFKKQSVGATENLLLASVLAKGKTVLRNVAKEPEIVDLVNMLKAMGAKIYGEGGDILEIYGVESLHGTEYTPIPDRIVAGTLMVAIAMCGGSVQIQNCELSHMEAVVSKITNSSCHISSEYGITQIESEGKILPIREIVTAPYPGFPTDMQSQFVTMLTQANGISLVNERVFESRFCYVDELKKMGADIEIVHDIAVVRGGRKLHGTRVDAMDLRGGSALVLAGLCAEGMTEVGDVFHIDRGYDSLEKMLKSIGANISRKEDQNEFNAVSW